MRRLREKTYQINQNKFWQFAKTYFFMLWVLHCLLKYDKIKKI